MKKDMKWIKEELKQLEKKATIDRDYQRCINNEIAATYFGSRKIAFKTVSNLLSHVEVQHTRTIEVPEFVDEWFKSNYPQSWWKKIAEWENEVSDEDRKVVDWYQDYNEDDFIIAWITGDYTVAKEKKYYARTKLSSLPNFANNGENYFDTLHDGSSKEVWLETKNVALARTMDEWERLNINDHNAIFILKD